MHTTKHYEVLNRQSNSTGTAPNEEEKPMEFRGKILIPLDGEETGNSSTERKVGRALGV